MSKKEYDAARKLLRDALRPIDALFAARFTCSANIMTPQGSLRYHSGGVTIGDNSIETCSFEQLITLAKLVDHLWRTCEAIEAAAVKSSDEAYAAATKFIELRS